MSCSILASRFSVAEHLTFVPVETTVLLSLEKVAVRISYIHGPGDAYGTFLQWQIKQNDARLIKQTYSGQFYDLIRELDGFGQIICPREVGESTDPRFEFTSARRDSGRGIKYYYEELRYALRVSRKIKDYNPDVIIVSDNFPTYYMDFLSKRPAKILSMHNTFWKPYGRPEGAKENVLYFARKLSLRKTRLAVCVSQECRRQLERVRSQEAVFSVLQVPRIKQQFQERKNHFPRDLLFVGRVEIDKGVIDLIYAFHQLATSAPQLTLKIVGEGSALNSCRTLAQQLGMNREIEFTGRLDADGVGRAYAAADLCLCPTQWSFNEGLATVPLEAAAYGVPTVMSEAVPAKELFSCRELVFEPGNVEDLAQGILKIATSRELYDRACNDARGSFISIMTEVGDWKSGMYECLERVG